MQNKITPNDQIKGGPLGRSLTALLSKPVDADEAMPETVQNARFTLKQRLENLKAERIAARARLKKTCDAIDKKIGNIEKIAALTRKKNQRKLLKLLGAAVLKNKDELLAQVMICLSEAEQTEIAALFTGMEETKLG